MFSKLTSTVDNVIDEGNAGNIRPATLVQLHKLGFKLVPLSLEHYAVISWTPIYEDSNFWALENIVSESPKFKNVATVFGKTHVKDSEGKGLYLNDLDCDSEPVYKILTTPIEEISDSLLMSKLQDLYSKSEVRTTAAKESVFEYLKETTVVVKTRKPYGFQVFWLSHTQHDHIGTKNCKSGHEFEIKTDKGSGHSTLPPSTHRHDPQFRYSHIGRRDKIAVIDEFYDVLTELLSECLIERNKTKASNGIKIKTFANFPRSKRLILNDDQIKDTVSQLIDYYQEGHRDAFTFEFSGFAFKRAIAEESAACIVKVLYIKTNDLETESRSDVIHGTYVNGTNCFDISGSSGLKKIIATLHGDEEQANKVVKSVIDIWQRYEIPIDSLDLNEVSYLTDKQLDKIKITSEYVEYCITTILKETPNDQIPVRQLFVGLCSSATHLPQNIAIETQSGAGKNYIIHKVISKFPQRDIIILSGMTPKALFHDQGITAVKNLESGEYEDLDEMVDSIDTNIENKEEEIENAKEKQRKEELRKEIKSLERQKKFLRSKAVKLIDLDGKVLVLLDVALT
jgi:hypothetical protein